jgi:predicted transcriptional regulator|nr:MAG TPA: hypothetical protein [Caudoviricetes sp.]
MSKAVMLSVRPKWCEKIINGDKTIEVRKTRPKLETPFKAYIYCSQGNDARRLRGSWGKVIGEFTCDRIYELAPINHAPDDVEKQACLTREEIVNYLKGTGYGWHIVELKIYDKPRDLGEFFPVCRYKNDDKSCPSRRVACSYQKYDYNPDGSINLVECGRTLERPPQSWCYVEAMDNG